MLCCCCFLQNKTLCIVDKISAVGTGVGGKGRVQEKNKISFGVLATILLVYVILISCEMVLCKSNLY